MRRAAAVVLAALLGAVMTLEAGQAADDPINTPGLSREVYFTVLDQCATAWDPADRNIYATDGASLNDVARATRTAFVTVWQADAWQRWRWEADCLQAARADQLGTPGSVRTTDDAITTATRQPRGYSAVLDQCATAWDPADRNIYATDGASLNDVARATRTAFVTVWQADAWQRWRWEADCLQAARSDQLGRPGGTRTTDDAITAPNPPPQVYSAILDQCTPGWDPTDRNIYATDGASLNDVARAERTTFVTVWQVDAWQRWRWEADCLRAAPPGRVATLDTVRVTDHPIGAPGLRSQDYSAALDFCAPGWNPADRNIYASDGSSLNDVDRATRTTFVTVWQVDAWQRWRWEADCLRAVPSGRLGTPGSVRTTDDAVTIPSLPTQVYFAILDQCAPAWDPMDRNIYTTDGASLNFVDRATRTVFVTLWQIDAWQRWRWEADCLRVAFTPKDDSPGGATGPVSTQDSIPHPTRDWTPDPTPASTPVPTPDSTPDSTPDPADSPNYLPVYAVAVARGAYPELAQRIATQVVTDDRVKDFLDGTHEGVLYGEYGCLVRSDACPLAPEAANDGGQSSSGGQGGGPSGGRPRASPSRGTSGGDRFAGYHMPICTRGPDGVVWCRVDPEWPVLEYRDGKYYRCKSLSPEGYGVGCRPY